MVISRSFGTHDGLFHADEVTACALLLYYGLIDREKWVRTRNKQLLDGCEFVCDVGGSYDPKRKKFDHHQLSYGGDLSSAGMIWAYLKEQGIVSAVVYDFLNHSLIQGVDAHDNGKVSSEVGVCSFSQIISNFVPIRYDVSAKEQDRAFSLALDFVLGHITRAMDRFAYVQECKEKVRLAMKEEKNFLLFEESMPWIDSFFELGGENHPAQFVVMPSGKQWKVRGIPPSSIDRMKVRKPLPLEWAGLLEEDFKKVSGLPGAVFCHKGRFISVWETKEDAFKALGHALSKES
ncbi:MAG: MYG1 family protein [Chlamydiota bacterium]